MSETLHDVSGLQWLDNLNLAGTLKVGKTSSQRIWPLDGGPSRVLAPGETGQLSPDRTRIISREKEEWVVREMAGARHELIRVPFAYGDNLRNLMVWSRDSQQVVLVQEARAQALPADTVATENGVRVVDLGAQAEARDAAGVFTTTLTVLDLRASTAPRRFPFSGLIDALEWGTAEDLYFVVQPFWNTGGEPPATVVRVLQDGKSREVFRVGGVMQGIDPRVSPDGRWMSVTCDIDTQIWDDFNSLLLVDLASGKVRRLTQKEYVIGSSVRWAPDSSGMYFAVRDGGWTQLRRTDLDGRVTALTETPTLKREPELSPDGRWLAYVAYNGLGRVELRVLDAKSKHDRQVTLLDDPAKRYQLGRFERVKFPTPDGLQMAAWVVYPPNFDPSKKYPLYIDVHGGGPGSYLYLMGAISAVVAQGPLEWHAWATRGYIVFVPDYRSSGEYGPGIAAARHRGDYGGIEADARDVEAGTQWMLTRPYVDATRLGLLGISAGGARVNLLLTRSSRYRAGVLLDAIGAGVLPDFLAGLTGAHTGSTASQMFWETRVGKLADKPKDYLGGFLFDGYKSKIPTLIMVGGDRNKGALDPLSAEVLFSLLRQNHVPARMLRYVDEGHGLGTAASARHAFEQVHAWFAEHMDMATDAEGRVLFEGSRVKPRKSVAQRVGAEL
jgi:dipeptidyl aminopeptidase/acylaminoacyl peptidase